MWCTPGYFNGVCYFIASGQSLRALALSNGLINPTLLAQGAAAIGSASPSISANGTNNGIVWAATGFEPRRPPRYNATNVAQELYNSSQNSRAISRLTGEVHLSNSG